MRLIAKVSVAQLARDYALPEAEVRLGLEEAVKAGYLRVIREGVYEATLPEKAEPPADQAEGSVSCAAPVGNDASHGGRDVG